MNNFERNNTNMPKPIGYGASLVYAMNKLQRLTEKLVLLGLAMAFPEEIARLRYLLWTASLLDSGHWRVSTLSQLCHNYWSLSVPIGKIGQLKAPSNS